jgi:hypothetical protein
MRSAAFGAWIAVIGCWRLTACGPRWTKAVCARDIGRVLREFMYDLAGKARVWRSASRAVAASTDPFVVVRDHFW